MDSLNSDLRSKLMRLPEVMEVIGIKGRVTIWRWVKAGTFPKPVKLGPRLHAWRRADIEQWIETRETAA